MNPKEFVCTVRLPLSHQHNCRLIRSQTTSSSKPLDLEQVKCEALIKIQSVHLFLITILLCHKPSRGNVLRFFLNLFCTIQDHMDTLPPNAYASGGHEFHIVVVPLCTYLLLICIPKTTRLKCHCLCSF